MWKINKDLMTVELAKFTLEMFNQYHMKNTLGLLKVGKYVTYTDDVKYKLEIYDNNFMLMTNDYGVVILHGLAHLINDKIREMYPVLKDL